MKKIIFIFSLIVLIGCKSKKVDVKPTEKPVEVKMVKLVNSEVDSNQKNKAYELGNRVLMTCNTSKFKPFNESEATQSVINNISLEKLSKTCSKYRQWYGTYRGIELVEIFKNNFDNSSVYRYKALYTKKVANKELRVFMNSENKVSAIKTLDWVDTFDNK